MQSLRSRWALILTRIFTKFPPNPKHVPVISADYKKESYYHLLFHKYSLVPSQVAQGSKVVASLFLVSLTLLLLTFVEGLIASMLALFLSLLVYLQLNAALFMEIQEQERKSFSLLYLFAMDLEILLENIELSNDIFLNVFKYTEPFLKSLFTNYPQVVRKIRLGKAPESLEKKEFTSFLFWDIYSLLKTSMQSEDPLTLKDLKLFFDFNPDYAWKRFNQQIDTNLSFMFFLGVFFPLGVNYLLFLNQITLGQLFISSLFFVILFNYQVHKFQSNHALLFGVLSAVSPNRTDEFEIFLEFFKNFSKHLSFNAPENALIKAYQHNLGKFASLHPLFRNTAGKFLSLETFFNDYQKILTLPQLKVFLNFIGDHVIKDSEHAVPLINSLLLHLEEQKIKKATYNERLKGEQGKVKIFIIFLPFILGIFVILLIFFTTQIGSASLIFPGGGSNEIDSQFLLPSIFSQTFSSLSLTGSVLAIFLLLEFFLLYWIIKGFCSVVNLTPTGVYYLLGFLSFCLAVLLALLFF